MRSSPVFARSRFNTAFSDDSFFYFGAGHIRTVIPNYTVESKVFADVVAHFAKRNINHNRTQKQNVQIQNAGIGYRIQITGTYCGQGLETSSRLK